MIDILALLHFWIRGRGLLLVVVGVLAVVDVVLRRHADDVVVVGCLEFASNDHCYEYFSRFFRFEDVASFSSLLAMTYLR